MKILVACAQHPGSLGAHVAEGLRDTGCEVVAFDYRRATYGPSYDRPRPAWQRRLRSFRWRFLEGRAIRRMERELLALVDRERPEVFLTLKGELFRATFLRELGRRLRLVNWYPDAPVWVGSSSPAIVEAIPCYDLCVSFDEYFCPELERFGARRAICLPFAHSPRLHRPLALGEEERRNWGSEVCFVGDWQARRGSWLLPLAGAGLRIWGNGWERAAPELRACWQGGPAWGEDAARIFSASRLTVNVHAPQSVTAPNMRDFEAAACGIPMVSDPVPCLGRFFRIGREVLVAGDPEAMARTVRDCLADPEGTAALGRRARERGKEYSYALRMRTLLEALASVPAPAAGPWSAGPWSAGPWSAGLWSAGS